MSRSRQTNKIVERKGSVLIVDISTTRYPNTTMIIDYASWRYLQEIGVGRVNLSNTGYGQCYYKGGNVLVHRLLLPDSQMVDHINENRTDNRKCNIRAADSGINNRNRAKYKSNTSGVLGVGWYAPTNKWRVKIKSHGKEHHIGYYEKFEDAVSARRDAEKTYHPEKGLPAQGELI